MEDEIIRRHEARDCFRNIRCGETGGSHPAAAGSVRGSVVAVGNVIPTDSDIAIGGDIDAVVIGAVEIEWESDRKLNGNPMGMAVVKVLSVESPLMICQ